MCVHAQGFEYDYAGVIIGPDLVWRGDRWVTRPEYSHDTRVRRGTSEEFDRAVRNTYKVLLTRGMRGSLIHSTDPETQRHWEQFHHPKSLVLALVGEVGEARRACAVAPGKLRMNAQKHPAEGK